MRIKQVVFSVIYSLGQITVGLLLHPYQTMQSLVMQRIFIWLTLLPCLFLSFLTILWKYAMVPIVQTVFSCSVVHFFACDWIIFVSNVVTFFCIYWQVLLLYLLVRFTLVYRK